MMAVKVNAWGCSKVDHTSHSRIQILLDPVIHSRNQSETPFVEPGECNVETRAEAFMLLCCKQHHHVTSRWKEGDARS